MLWRKIAVIIAPRKMNESRYSDPAERGVLRFFYRNWHPTRLGLLVNRLMCWWSGLGLPPKFQVALEVQGRKSGRTRSNPVVIATVEDKSYLVSMLGPESEWVKNVGRRMATPLSAGDADGVFTLWRCHRSRGHPFSESTCESLLAAESTSRLPSERRYLISRRLPGLILCTELTLHEGGFG